MLRVPPRRTNYLFNPEDPVFESINMLEREPFAFDSRLIAGI